MDIEQEFPIAGTVTMSAINNAPQITEQGFKKELAILMLKYGVVKVDVCCDALKLKETLRDAWLPLP